MTVIQDLYSDSKKAMLVGLGYFAFFRPRETVGIAYRLIPALAYQQVKDAYLVVRIITQDLLIPELRAGLGGARASVSAASALQANLIAGGLTQPLFILGAIPIALTIERGATRLGVGSNTITGANNTIAY